MIMPKRGVLVALLLPIPRIARIVVFDPEPLPNATRLGAIALRSRTEVTCAFLSWSHESTATATGTSCSRSSRLRAETIIPSSDAV